MNTISHSDFYFPDNDFYFLLSRFWTFDEVDDCDFYETFGDYEIENELRYETRAIIQERLNGLQTDIVKLWVPSLSLTMISTLTNTII